MAPGPALVPRLQALRPAARPRQRCQYAANALPLGRLWVEPQRLTDEEDDFPTVDLSVLTERQREVVLMRYRGDLSYREIGAFLSLNHVVVWRHHARALTKIERQMGNGTGPVSET